MKTNRYYSIHFLILLIVVILICFHPGKLLKHLNDVTINSCVPISIIDRIRHQYELTIKHNAIINIYYISKEYNEILTDFRDILRKWIYTIFNSSNIHFIIIWRNPIILQKVISKWNDPPPPKKQSYSITSRSST